MIVKNMGHEWKQLAHESSECRSTRRHLNIFQVYFIMIHVCGCDPLTCETRITMVSSRNPILYPWDPPNADYLLLFNGTEWAESSTTNGHYCPINRSSSSGRSVIMWTLHKPNSVIKPLHCHTVQIIGLYRHNQIKLKKNRFARRCFLLT